MVHDMNDILNMKLGTSNTAAVHMIHHSHHHVICGPFLHPTITTNRQVNINNIIEMQRTILNSYRNKFFSIHRTSVFHLDSEANIHATNNKQDFINFHPIKCNTHLAVGSIA